MAQPCTEISAKQPISNERPLCTDFIEDDTSKEDGEEAKGDCGTDPMEKFRHRQSMLSQIEWIELLICLIHLFGFFCVGS